jgi:hypothetical protein
MLGRWDESVAVFYRALEAWNDTGGHAAGFGISGFVAGLEIGRARGDSRLMSAATEAIVAIVALYPRVSSVARLADHVRGEVSFADNHDLRFSNYPSQIIERRVALAADLRADLPPEVLPALLARSIQQKLPLLEAQVRRAVGLAQRDPAEMAAAIATWERVGSLPNLGRARAERGLLTGDQAETEAGLAILKKLGDVNYVDRFVARV